MGIRRATIVFADIIGASEISNNTPVKEYSGILDQFQGGAEVAKEFILDSPDYQEGRTLEFWAKGDEAGLILHSAGDVLKGERAEQAVVQDIQNAILFAIHLKLLWLTSRYNAERVKDMMLPRDLGVGIHHALVYFGKRSSTEEKETSEGFAINMAKRIEGSSRQGRKSRIFVSQQVEYLASEAEVPVAFDGGKSYELKGITTESYLYEVTQIADQEFLARTPVLEALTDELDQRLKEGIALEDYYTEAQMNRQEFWLRKLVYYILCTQENERRFNF